MRELIGGKFEILRSTRWQFIYAIAVVLAAVAIRFLLDPYLGRSGFAIFLAAILIAAWVGGLFPSLVAQTLILVANALWFNEAKDAEQRSFLVQVVNLLAFYGVGTAVALLSSARRLARRREAQQRNDAIEQREWLRATLACMGEGVLTCDASGRVTLMNAAAEQLIGRTLGDAQGRRLADILVVCEEESETAIADPIGYVLHPCADHGEFPRATLISSRGARLPIAFSASPIEMPSAGVVGHVLVIRDESERRRTETAMQEADRRKDEFIATLAHELRNPLAPICAGLELIKMPDSDQQTVDEVHAIMERQTKQMVRLIDDLLDASRITRGKFELRKCPVMLADVIRSAVEASQPLIAEAGHRLDVRLPPNQILLSADQERLTQVLSNLLNNAAKFTPPRGAIELVVEELPQEVAISVTDNGVGIPADKLKYVFEMFAQVNGQVERVKSGLGIGLTLAKQLVEMHAGVLEVDSAGSNRGSTFRVRLPRMARPPATARPAQPAARPAPAKAPETARRVLVVDDNADAQNMLAQMIKALGHTVCTAGDGLQAIEAIDSFNPDMVLMDLGMPHLDGYDAARRIRGLPRGAQITLIATTGWGQEEDRQKALAAGFDSHLVKPVDMLALQALLDGGGERADRGGAEHLTNTDDTTPV